MQVNALIQARMSSTRLRGKTLMPVAGQPLLARVVRQVKAHSFIDKVVVATSDATADDPIQAYCKFLGIDCVRGHPTRVLDRYLLVAESLSKYDQIIRITADNCFSRVALNQRVFDDHIKGGFDYSGVEGLSHVVYEFIRVGAFQQMAARELPFTDYDLEHVTPFLRRKELNFKTQLIPPETLGLIPALDRLLTIDTKADLARVELLLKEVQVQEGHPDFSIIYNWLSERKE